jgi:hypothetical protein
MVIGNAHLGEDVSLRSETIVAVRAQLPPQIPTMVQGADTLHDVGPIFVVCCLNSNDKVQHCSCKGKRSLCIALVHCCEHSLTLPPPPYYPQLLLSLGLGVDLLSTNYPAALSGMGQALALHPALLCVDASAVDSVRVNAGKGLRSNAKCPWTFRSKKMT